MILNHFWNIYFHYITFYFITQSICWIKKCKQKPKMSCFFLIIISSSCHAISMDISDPFSPPLPIVHCFQQVFRATPLIYSELLYVGLSWLPEPQITNNLLSFGTWYLNRCYSALKEISKNLQFDHIVRYQNFDT